jgi:hypothetical protein
MPAGWRARSEAGGGLRRLSARGKQGRGGARDGGEEAVVAGSGSRRRIGEGEEEEEEYNISKGKNKEKK